MDLASFSGAFQWVIGHGYTLMFLAMLIEGPVVTAAATFAVAVGYFNIYAVFVLALLGDLVADVIYYAIGYGGRHAVINKFGHRIGLTDKRMERIEKLAKEHSVKTLIVLKLAPVLPTPGLMLVGVTKMPIKKFVLTCLFIIIPKTVLFMVVGYYFGYAYNSINKYISNAGLLLAASLLLIIFIYFVYNKISARIAEKIEKI
jgi:membrane protein DedA with SNARE-associated domain